MSAEKGTSGLPPTTEKPKSSVVGRPLSPPEMPPRPKVANINELLTPRGKSSREIENDLMKGVAILRIVDVKPLTSV